MKNLNFASCGPQITRTRESSGARGQTSGTPTKTYNSNLKRNSLLSESDRSEFSLQIRITCFVQVLGGWSGGLRGRCWGSGNSSRSSTQPALSRSLARSPARPSGRWPERPRARSLARPPARSLARSPAARPPAPFARPPAWPPVWEVRLVQCCMALACTDRFVPKCRFPFLKF